MNFVKFVLFILVSFQSTLSVANVDVNKFCIDRFCLGDSILKHGGVASIKTSDSAPLKLKFPSCTMYFGGEVTFGRQDVKQTPRFYVVIEPFTEYLSKGLESYYRIIQITAVYSKVSNSDSAGIYETILKRANVAPSKIQDNSKILVWSSLPKDRPFQLEGRDIVGFPLANDIDVSLRVDEESARISLFRGFAGFANKSEAYKNQPGCTNVAPKL